MAAVATVALVVGVGIPLFNNQRSLIDLSQSSKNVSAKHVKHTKNIMVAEALIERTEAELFTTVNSVIFNGTITEIENIELNLNGEKEYRAIAKIKVNEVCRGDYKAEDSLYVLLPCPTNSHLKMTDPETVSAMRVGMTGVFMPMQYDATSSYKRNGATLVLSEIAAYGFDDGSRYAFLETEQGLVFARWAYPSIADAITLEQIEDYIAKIIA